MAFSMNLGVQFGLTDATSDTALKFQARSHFDPGYVCLWHIADYFSRPAECLLSGVMRTLLHAAQHVR